MLGDSKNYDLMRNFARKQSLLSLLFGLLGTAFTGAAAASLYAAYYYNNISFYYGGTGFLIGIIFYVFSWRKRNLPLCWKKEM